MPWTSKLLWWFATITHVRSLLRISAPRSVNLMPITFDTCFSPAELALKEIPSKEMFELVGDYIMKQLKLTRSSKRFSASTWSTESARWPRCTWWRSSSWIWGNKSLLCDFWREKSQAQQLRQTPNCTPSRLYDKLIRDPKVIQKLEMNSTFLLPKIWARCCCFVVGTRMKSKWEKNFYRQKEILFEKFYLR